MRMPCRKIDLDVLKQQISPYDFYLRELDLAQFGTRSSKWAIAGRCPFHDDHQAGSFKVNLETGSFKCWSCGVAGGDIVSFLQQRDRLSFREALERLVRDWRITC